MQMHRKEGVKWLVTEKMMEICWHLSSFPSLLWHNINMSTRQRADPGDRECRKTEFKWQHSSSVSQHAEQPKAEGHARGRGSQTAAHTQRYSFMSFNYAVKSVSSSHEGKHLQGRCWLLYILKSQFIFVAVAHWPCRLSVNETKSWRNPLKSFFFALPVWVIKHAHTYRCDKDTVEHTLCRTLIHTITSPKKAGFLTSHP